MATVGRTHQDSTGTVNDLSSDDELVFRKNRIYFEQSESSMGITGM